MVLSPYNGKIIRVGAVSCLAAMSIMVEGSLRCSLYISPKVLDVSTMYSLSHASSPDLIPVDGPTPPV